MKSLKRKVDSEVKEKIEHDQAKIEYLARTIYALRLKQNLKAIKKEESFYSRQVLDARFSELKREI